MSILYLSLFVLNDRFKSKLNTIFIVFHGRCSMQLIRFFFKPESQLETPIHISLICGWLSDALTHKILAFKVFAKMCRNR